MYIPKVLSTCLLSNIAESLFPSMKFSIQGSSCNGDLPLPI